jgi:hypothetical protein
MMLKPPSTNVISPVTALASSEDRNTAVPPTSSLVTWARRGAIWSNGPYSLRKSRTPDADSVRIGPAEMALTRMPSGPSSEARYRTAASRAALDTPITL